MSDKSPATPRTALIPVTTMEEIFLLSPHERADLEASLVEAEKEIAQDQGVAYDSEEARERFMRGYSKRKTPSVNN